MVVDLVIKNCKIVKPTGILSAGIAVDDGKIVSIARSSNLPFADRTIDAKGNYVMPGVVDPHTHLNNGPEWPDLVACENRNFETETKSASIGGVTTLMTLLHYADGPSYKQVFDDAKNRYESRALIDGAFNVAIMNERHICEIPECVHNLGIAGFKFNMACKEKQTRTIGPIGAVPLDDGMRYTVFEKVKEVGPPALAMVHAENMEVFFALEKRLVSEGRDDLVAWTEARPAFIEEEAIRRAIFFAKTVASPLYIAHVSIGSGVDIVANAKAKGVKITAETCPHYLTFTKDTKAGKLGKVNPSLKNEEDVQKLWWGIERGIIDTIGSDHVPIMKEMKTESPDIWSCPAGFPGTATILPIMLSEGVNKRRISLERVAEICSCNPARIFGIWPEKGAIEIGSDADLTIVDLKKEKVVKPEMLKSRADWTLYENWKLKGWPVATLVRGEVVMEDGEIVGTAGTGKYLPRKAQRSCT